MDIQSFIDNDGNISLPELSATETALIDKNKSNDEWEVRIDGIIPVRVPKTSSTLTFLNFKFYPKGAKTLLDVPDMLIESGISLLLDYEGIEFSFNQHIKSERKYDMLIAYTKDKLSTYPGDTLKDKCNNWLDEHPVDMGIIEMKNENGTIKGYRMKRKSVSKANEILWKSYMPITVGDHIFYDKESLVYLIMNSYLDGKGAFTRYIRPQFMREYRKACDKLGVDPISRYQNTIIEYIRYVWNTSQRMKVDYMSLGHILSNNGLEIGDVI